MIIERAPNRILITPPDEIRLIPVTETSWPQDASIRHYNPVDLSEFGYVEEEYIINSRANVYDWPNGERYPHVRTENAPYCNRIMVRKPADPKAFNGIVIVELYNPAGVYDRSAAGWGQCYEHYIRRGYGWVGLTISDNGIAALKKFDPERYKDLGFPNPDPVEKRPAQAFGLGGRPVDVNNENGLKWDYMSQVAALIKSDDARSPFNGYKVKKVMATGTTGMDLSTYVAAIQPICCLENDAPVYDGFMIVITYGPGPINQYGGTFDPADKREMFYSDVPFIHVWTNDDVLHGKIHFGMQYTNRRPDADEPFHKFVRYECAGASGQSMFYWTNAMGREDAESRGFTFKEIEDRPHEFPNRYVYDAVLENLVRWMVDGVPAPSMPNIEIKNLETGDESLYEYNFDAAGNCLGGLRIPQVDVPMYHYETNGKYERLPDDVIKSLYKDKDEYVAKVIKEAVKAVAERRLVYEDAEKTILDALNEEFPE